MITQNEVEVRFGIIRPDEFAECKNGVLAAGQLYEKLWSFVPRYEAPLPADSEEPCYGLDSIARFWNELTADEQAHLVRLDDEAIEEEKRMMRDYYTRKGQPIPDHYL